MAFRFVKIRGANTATPTIVSVYASGVIFRGSVVEFSRANNRVEPATANTTTTNILGIALDYVQGASNTMTRVIPFVPGQLWEADMTNTLATNQIFVKHALTNSATVANTSTDVNTAKGVFILYSLTVNTGAVTVTQTGVGEFIRGPVGWGGTDTAGYF